MRRDWHSSTSDPLNPIYIAGYCVAGVAVLSLAVWLLVHLFRQCSAAKREESRGAAFLSVRGVVNEQSEKERSIQPGFSRTQINSSVILPDKVLARPPRTREEVIEFHRQSGTFPRPFSAKPFSFALSAGSQTDPSSPTQGSLLSFGSSSNPGSRLSVYSVMSAYSSVDTTGCRRKVSQMFNPVLPDELLLSHVGEELTLVQSFDDGWCLVGRENSVFASPPKSLFKGETNNDVDVELGVVPAWCFIKPVKGLRTERPVRSSSLGITVQMTSPAFSSRDAVLSWSNF